MAINPVGIFDILLYFTLGSTITTHIHLLLALVPKVSSGNWKKPVNMVLFSCIMGLLCALTNQIAVIWFYGRCDQHRAGASFYGLHKFGAASVQIIKAIMICKGLVSERKLQAFKILMLFLLGCLVVGHSMNATYMMHPIIIGDDYCVPIFWQGFQFPFLMDSIINILASLAYITKLSARGPITNQAVRDIQHKSIIALLVSVTVSISSTVYFLCFAIPPLTLPVFFIEIALVNSCLVYANRVKKPSGDRRESVIRSRTSSKFCDPEDGLGTNGRRKTMVLM